MLDSRRGRHEGIVIAVALLATGSVLILGRPSGLAQIVLLSAGILIFGVPHGALDHRPGRRVLYGSFGIFWWLPFLIGYLGLSASVFLAFAFWPELTLAGFLALSLVHFGLDAGRDPAIKPDSAAPSPIEPTPRSFRRLVAWGAPAIVLPAAFHSREVSELFSWVVASEVPEAWVARGGLVGLVLWLICLVLLVATGEAQNLEALRLVVYLPLFAVLPPLMAFGVFFCLDHSLRHLLAESKELTAGGSPVGLPRLMAEAAPATLGTACAALWLGIIWLGPQGFESTTVRVIFQTLAALTLPHMLLTWADRRRAVLGIRESRRHPDADADCP